jgi:hypothetical protein
MNLKEKAEHGIYELVDPFDYLLLELLPDEGELVMGYYPLTKTSEQLVREKFDLLTPTQIAQDIRRLLRQGLVAKVRTRGSKEQQFGWQRTKKGKKLYEDWKKKQSNNTEGKTK